VIIKKSKLDIAKKIILALLAIVLVVIIAERFITQGTLLGYQVRQPSNNPLVSDSQDQPSKACEKADEAFVKSVLGVKVDRIASNFADQTKPTFRSICSYASKGKDRRYVTIVIRQAKDEANAKSELERFSQREGVQQKDSGYYSSKSRQLMSRSGDNIAVVTVSQPTQKSSISSLDAANKIIKKLL